MSNDAAYHQIINQNGHLLANDLVHNNKPKSCALILTSALSIISTIIGVVVSGVLIDALFTSSWNGIRRQTQIECNESCSLHYMGFSFIFLGFYQAASLLGNAIIFGFAVANRHYKKHSRWVYLTIGIASLIYFLGLTGFIINSYVYGDTIGCHFDGTFGLDFFSIALNLVQASCFIWAFN
eukprot:403367689